MSEQAMNPVGVLLPILPIGTIKQDTFTEIMLANFHRLPSILDYRLFEWVSKLTDPINGAFSNGLSPKQMETLAQAQWMAAVRAGRNVRQPWRGSNHLSALLSNEVRAGRLTRLQKACYVGRENRTQNTQSKLIPNESTRCALCSVMITLEISIYLKCKRCNAHAHVECAYDQRGLPMHLLACTLNWLHNWTCPACKHCNICGQPGRRDILVCSNCDSMEHVQCQRVMDVEPSQFWLCSLCSKKNNGQIGSNGRTVTDTSTVCIVSYSDVGPIMKISTPHNEESEEMMEQGDLIVDEDVQQRDTSVPIGNSAQRKLTNDESDLQTSTSYSSKRLVSNLHSLKSWSPDQVGKYFDEIGYPETAIAFRREEVDGAGLLLIQRPDIFYHLGLKVGQALKTYKTIKRLQNQYKKYILKNK